jgi:hypothetical protein
VHFRLAQFADRQHAALSRYLQSEEHSSHKDLLALKQRGVQEMERTISSWQASGVHRMHDEWCWNTQRLCRQICAACAPSHK